MKDLIQEIESLKIKMKECEYKYKEYSRYIVKAISVFENNIQMVMNNDELLTYMGILYLYNNEAEKSLEYLKRAYNKNTNIQTISNLAYFYLNEGDIENEMFQESPQKAVKILKEVTDVDCNSYIPYALIAECYFELKNYSEMEKYLRKAIEIEKNNVILYNLSVSLFFQNRYEESVQYLIMLKKQEKLRNVLNIHLGIAICSWYINEKDNVRMHLKHIEENNQYGEISVLEIAKLYLLIQGYEDAIRNYLKAENYYYSVDWISEELYCYHKLGKKDEFNSLFNRFLENKEIEIKQNREDKEFSIEFEKELQSSIEELEKAKTKILGDSYKIDDTFEMYIEKECYLFGCVQHDNRYKI